MRASASSIEEQRVALQAELDSAKSQSERNRMGQFATPAALALEMLQYANEFLENAPQIRFIDPGFGTGSFYSALCEVFPDQRLDYSVGYEIDPHYGSAAERLWRNTSLQIRLEDFTHAEPPPDPEKFNLLICNPPYVRHHHITIADKKRLKERVWRACGVEIDGLAGLYCYFICLCHTWMADGGLAGWLVPSEFMDVNYGNSIKSYLLNKVTLIHIHRFDPNEVQFGDALVSSTLVWLKNENPPRGHKVRMSFGGSLCRPELEQVLTREELGQDRKWTKYPLIDRRPESDSRVLSDFFDIKRGLATGNNRYFILSDKQIESRGLPIAAFRPILPSPRYVPKDEVLSDEKGVPLLEKRLFLLDCRLSEDEIETHLPSLKQYLEEGKAQGVADSYLCRHRKVWYSQEHRPEAPFLCTYLGRSDSKNGRPFRFILNHSHATASNVYLMLYPKEPLNQWFREQPESKRWVWKLLNEISSKSLLDEGRVYGGGLHKLEPKELGNVPAVALAEMLSEMGILEDLRQARLIL